MYLIEIFFHLTVTSYSGCDNVICGWTLHILNSLIQPRGCSGNKSLCACLAQIIVIREHLASSFCHLLNISVNIIAAVSLTLRQHMPGHAAFTPNSTFERGNTRSKCTRRISGRQSVLVAMDTVSGVLDSLHQALVASGSVCVLMCVMHWCESVAKDRQRPFSLLSSTSAWPVLIPPPSSHLPPLPAVRRSDYRRVMLGQRVWAQQSPCQAVICALERQRLMGSGNRETETERKTLRVRRGGKSQTRPLMLLIYLTGFILWHGFTTKWMVSNILISDPGEIKEESLGRVFF